MTPRVRVGLFILKFQPAPDFENRAKPYFHSMREVFQ